MKQGIRAETVFTNIREAALKAIIFAQFPGKLEQHGQYDIAVCRDRLSNIDIVRH
jgi:hypothetical protein